MPPGSPAILEHNHELGDMVLAKEAGAKDQNETLLALPPATNTLLASKAFTTPRWSAIGHTQNRKPQAVKRSSDDVDADIVAKRVRVEQSTQQAAAGNLPRYCHVTPCITNREAKAPETTSQSPPANIPNLQLNFDKTLDNVVVNHINNRDRPSHRALELSSAGPQRLKEPAMGGQLALYLGPTSFTTTGRWRSPRIDGDDDADDDDGVEEHEEDGEDEKWRP